VSLFPPLHPPLAATVEKNHGRVEQRDLWALSVNPEDIGFTAAAQVVRIHRHFTTVKTGKESDETVFGITAIPPLPDVKANGEVLLDVARGQWSIENGNHYTRDRSYDEDRCQVRNPNAAHILATLRSMARFLMKRGAHQPKNAYQKTTPALNRFCDAHRLTTIRWLLSKKPPF